MVMIKVHKLVKRFGSKTVLRGLDFDVQQGEFVALLGPNGAGKTTFLRILASLARPTLGTVQVAGYQPSGSGGSGPCPAGCGHAPATALWRFISRRELEVLWKNVWHYGVEPASPRGA